MPEKKFDLVEEARAEAWRIFREENFKIAVQTEIIRLKTHKPWWHKIFPFEIKLTIKRRT